MKSRTQGSRPRPRTQKKSEAKAKDSFSEDRHSRGQGQGPRTQAQVLSKKKKKSLHKNFSSAPKKFQQFKKYCCPRAEDRPIFEDLRPRGQGQGLNLRGQGQGQRLQNVSSRTPPLLINFQVRLQSLTLR